MLLQSSPLHGGRQSGLEDPPPSPTTGMQLQLPGLHLGRPDVRGVSAVLQRGTRSPPAALRSPGGLRLPSPPVPPHRRHGAGLPGSPGRGSHPPSPPAAATAAAQKKLRKSPSRTSPPPPSRPAVRRSVSPPHSKGRRVVGSPPRRGSSPPQPAPSSAARPVRRSISPPQQQQQQQSRAQKPLAARESPPPRSVRRSISPQQQQQQQQQHQQSRAQKPLAARVSPPPRPVRRSISPPQQQQQHASPLAGPVGHVRHGDHTPSLPADDPYIATLTSQLAAAETRCAAAEESCEQLRAAATGYEREIEQLKGQLAEAHAALNDQDTSPRRAWQAVLDEKGQMLHEWEGRIVTQQRELEMREGDLAQVEDEVRHREALVREVEARENALVRREQSLPHLRDKERQLQERLVDVQRREEDVRLAESNVAEMERRISLEWKEMEQMKELIKRNPAVQLIELEQQERSFALEMKEREDRLHERVLELTAWEKRISSSPARPDRGGSLPSSFTFSSGRKPPKHRDPAASPASPSPSRKINWTLTG